MSHMPTTNTPASSSNVPSVSLINSTGGNVLAGSAIYCSSDGAYGFANASAASSASCIGLTMTGSTVGATTLVQAGGVVTLSAASWDAVAGTTGGLIFNHLYFLSLVNGQITDVPPVAVGQFVVFLGIGISTTQLRLIVQPPIGL